jgi:signal recognition particle receptor subunit beta
MSDYKLIFTGPSGAGKTTAIAAISDVPPVKTEESSAGIAHVGKKGITVALDYGLMKIGGQDKIHLFGTPGQERFDFMWEILTEGGLGLILLVDNSRPDPLRDMAFFLNAFKKFIARSKVAIGVTQMDLRPEPGLDSYHKKLQEFGLNPPLFEVDARVKQDVALLVQALLYSLDPGLP